MTLLTFICVYGQAKASDRATFGYDINVVTRSDGIFLVHNRQDHPADQTSSSDAFHVDRFAIVTGCLYALHFHRFVVETGSKCVYELFCFVTIASGDYYATAVNIFSEDARDFERDVKTDSTVFYFSY